MEYRPYESERDKHACYRIWQEVGWVHDEPVDGLDWFWTHGGSAFVAEMAGEAECLVTSAPGDVRYQEELLPFLCITGVTTSRLGRKQKLAGRLTAATVAEGVAAGAIVAGLGMFEQGYYNRLGFGTGAYEHFVALPVPELKVNVTPRVPKRLTLDDWEAIHAARLKRRRGHGSGSLFPPGFTRGRMHDSDGKAFGLGYADDPDGGLSHLVWCSARNVGHGPYDVKYLIYRTREQFLELMALLKSLGDQVFSIKVHEPPEVQLQDLVHQPFRNHDITRGSSHQIDLGAAAWWQMRICDLPACLAQTHLRGESVRFNLVLSDPIARYLPEDAPWRGVAGEYVVTLGPESTAEPGQDASLPTMRTTVNAFTRLWLGVRPASGLAMTDEIEAPEGLLEALDDLIRLPAPHADWDY
jgi:hypothetical protein